jgi:hypothetical protein
MIEISPSEYHINCSYEEANLYCFQLNINNKTGWRILTIEDYLYSGYNLDLITDLRFVLYIRKTRTQYLQEDYHIMLVRDIIFTKKEQLLIFFRSIISLISDQ